MLVVGCCVLWREAEVPHRVLQTLVFLSGQPHLPALLTQEMGEQGERT